MFGININLLVLVGIFSVLLLIASLRFPVFFVIVLVLINERLLGIVPQKFGSGQYDLLRYYGVLLLLIAISMRFIFSPDKSKKALTVAFSRNTYSKYIVSILFIVVFSTIWGAFFIYHQPLRSLVLRPVLFLYYLSYYYLFLSYNNEQQTIRFLNAILLCSIIVSLLSAIDVTFFQGSRFFEFAHTSERLGHVRKVLFTFGMLWAYYYSLVRSFGKEESFSGRLWFASCSLILFLTFLFVQTSRQVLMSCCIATLWFLWDKGLLRLFFLSCVVVVLILFSYIYHNYDFNKTYLGRMYQYTKGETKKPGSSITVRLNAIKYYYKYYRKSYFLGFGLMSANTKYRNPVSRGISYYGFNLNDISLCGIIFQFGLQSLILIFVIVLRLYKDLGKIVYNGDDHKVAVLSSIRYFFIHLLVIVPLTTVFFYKEKAIYYAIMFYMMDFLKSRSALQH